MKKSYLLIFGLGLSLVSFGQKKTAPKKPNHSGLCVDVTSVKGKKNFVQKAAGDVIYSETFANGLAGENGAWTTTGADASVWMLDTDGPDGQYSATDNSDKIESTTNANGFMIFDADASNPAQPFTNREGQLVSPVIDLTGIASISITFEHAYRTCCSNTFVPKVDVSTDGFVNFTTFDANEIGFGVNEFTGTALKEINIDSYLATATNLNNFQFRFNFDGVNGANSHYFWQVDDVKLIEPYLYSLKASVPVWGSMGPWGARLPYSMVPYDQVAPIDFSMIVENKGSVTQTDVTLGTTIPEGSFTNTGDLGTIPAFSSDTINGNAAFTPDGTITTYNPTFAVNSSNTDANPADNNMTGQSIEINSTVYARDMRVVDGGSYNQGNGFEVGNIFDIYTANQTSSASLFVRSTSNTGASIYVRLYDLDPATGDFRFVTESDAYTITDADKGTMVTLNYQTTVDLVAGSSYLVVAGSFGDGGATNDLVVATSGDSEPQTTFYFDMTDQTWYYTTSTPMVRMNLVAPLSTKELAASEAMSVYPNPAKEKVTIDFELKNEATVAIQVTDLTGKVISSKTLGSKAAGAHTTTVETSALSNGVYILNVVKNGEVSSQKFTVNK